MNLNTAILIDRQNLGESFGRIIQVLKHSGKIGDITIARAYAHWRKQSKNIREEAAELGVQCVAVPPGKNGADLELALDAIEIANRMSIGCFAIVTGDGGFIFRALITRLRSSYHRTVIVCGPENNTRATLRSLCDAYVPIPSERRKSAITQPGFDGSSAVSPEVRTAAGDSVYAPGLDHKSKRALAVLQRDSHCRMKMEDGGLAISSGLVAELLRPFKNPRSGRRRWLVKMLLAASGCEESGVSLGKAPSSGEVRLFVKGHVPRGWKVLDS